MTMNVRPEAHDLIVSKLDAASRLLSEAKTLQETNRVIALAAAAETYARRQKLGQEAIDHAYAIKIYALSKLGELLKATPKAKGAKAGGTKTGSRGSYVEPRDNTPTYADLNLDKKTAMVAQQLAELPEDVRVQIAARETTITEARRQQNRAARGSVELPAGKYRVLYADPPWKYRDTRLGLASDTQKTDREQTAAEHHYPAMTGGELCALDVKSLAHKDSVLFCWCTFPLLFDALKVVEAWGFVYKTSFVWHKNRGSFGHYHKADAELLLIATRGSCTPDSEKRESQVIDAPVEGHSRKPEKFRKLIDRLYVHGKRLELFSRGEIPTNWESWGNE